VVSTLKVREFFYSPFLENDGPPAAKSYDGEHLLVLFPDEKISIVPISNVLDEVVTVHEMCTIRWLGGKKYQVEVLFRGENIKLGYRQLF